MDAIMVTLVAVLLANADGRTARMIAGPGETGHSDGRVFALYFAVFVLLAAASATGAVLASWSLGPGVLNLMAAMALLSAGGALLVPRRASAVIFAGQTFTRMGLSLLLYQLGDRNQFLILALGALSGSALWGMVGGAAGMLLAMLPIVALGPLLLDDRGGRRIRWLAAAALALWALLYLRRAFGV
jgi:Ca2+/H+ antiporter, TMEM165/GDT1 family